MTLHMPEKEFLWRKKRFVLAGKTSRFVSGGTISAEVCLGDKWYPVAFSMTGEGFQELAARYHHRVHLIEALSTYPLGGLLPCGDRKVRGKATKDSQKAMDTARWLGPLFLEWAKSAYRNNVSLYKRIVRLKRPEYYGTLPRDVAAFLV